MTTAEMKAKLTNLKQLRDQVAALSFAEPDKETFRQELLTITDGVLNDTIPTDPIDLSIYENYVELAILWNDLVIKSDVSCLCPEMTYCIMKMISLWDAECDKKIVVFTLGDFGINKQPYDTKVKAALGLIKLTTVYKTPLTKEPVFILVPDEFKDHVLSNVSLFHEVGHYIDFNNTIFQYVYDDIETLITSKPNTRLIREYFPWLINQVLDANNIKRMKDHIKEYIADVFGAIYAGVHILSYVSYLESADPNKDRGDHPTFANRKKLVDAFAYYSKYGSTSDQLLQMIIKHTAILTSHSPKIIQPLHPSEAYLNSAVTVSNIDEMMALFITPWSLLMSEREKSKLKKYPKGEYPTLISLPLYTHLEKELKQAINLLMGIIP